MQAPQPSPLRRGRLRWLALGASLGALIALAAVAPAVAQLPPEATPSVGGGVTGLSVTGWLNLVLRLALVLVVIWLAIMAMRWWVRRMNGGVAGGTRHLNVVESRSLGPNRSLQLVQVGNRAVLLGVTAERISAVLEINDPIEVERLTRPVLADDSPTSFRDAVSRLGSLTKWRPVIERQPRAPRPVARPAQSSAPIGGVQSSRLTRSAAPQRSRWARLARTVIGLEDHPRRPAAPGLNTPPAAPQANTRPDAGPAPRSIAAAAATAAELPASRAVRARSGYRQNQIAEAQRAIASVRAGLTR